MICLETGKIIEFFNEDLEKLQDQIAKKHGYKVVRHSHQLFVKPIKKKFNIFSKFRIFTLLNFY